MGKRRGTKRIIIVIVICLAVAALAITVLHKPSIAQYEDDFGFSLEKISVKTIDHYHHEDFRDSLAIYRVSVTGMRLTYISTFEEIFGSPIFVKTSYSFCQLIIINNSNEQKRY